MKQNAYDYDPVTLPYAPKRDKPLSLWNPRDYLLLLYWVFYFPQAVGWYVQKFGHLPHDINPIKAILQDPIQRRLALQGWILALVVPFVFAGLLALLGMEIDMSDVRLGVGIGLVSGMLLGLSFGVSRTVVGSVLFSILVGIAFGMPISLLLGLLGMKQGVEKEIVAASMMEGVLTGVMLGLTTSVLKSVFEDIVVEPVKVMAIAVATIIGVGLQSMVTESMLFGVIFVFVGCVVLVIFFIRLDDWLLIVLFKNHFNNRVEAQRLSLLPIGGLHRQLVADLSHDWQEGLIESEGLLRYSSQIIVVYSAIQAVLIQCPPSLLLRRVSEWCHMPLYDWDIVRFQSNNPYSGLQESFSEEFNIIIPSYLTDMIPRRWRRQANIKLRFDTPARAACAGFWFLHKEELAEAAKAFKVVRDLPHGEELYGNAQAMADALACKVLQDMALWEAPPEPPAELLRPQVRERLLLLHSVAELAALILSSSSDLELHMACNLAYNIVIELFKGLEGCPAPERDNLRQVVRQWAKIFISFTEDKESF